MGSPRTKSPRLGPQELVSFAFGTVARIWWIADSPFARLRMAMITPAPAADSRERFGEGLRIGLITWLIGAAAQTDA